MIARIIGRLLALTLASGAGAPLLGQTIERDPSIMKLPRPGYEPRTVIVGSTILQPSLEARLAYDNNIFATPHRGAGDEIVTISPDLLVEREGATTYIKTDLHADLIRYKSHTRENVNSFGGSGMLRKSLGHDDSVQGTLSFDRTFERRSDPEAIVDPSRPPALINLSSAELQYRHSGRRVGVLVDAVVTKIDYLAAADANRDLTNYHVRVRGSLNIGKIAVFIEPFVNRRDFRLPEVVTGIFGDATTTGALLGLTFDLADKLTGDFGAGGFRAKPDGRQGRAFSGLAINGRLVWRPRTRTAVTLDAYRGDVATVRSGALGRIDTRVGLSVDEEIHHDLILRVAGGLRDIHYRGGASDQRYRLIEAELRYLANRHVTLLASAAYTHRNSDRAAEDFERERASLGVRLAY